MKQFVILSIFLVILSLAARTEEVKPALIPLPKTVEWTQEQFTLSSKTVIVDSTTSLSVYLQNQIHHFTGFQLQIHQAFTAQQSIVLKIDKQFAPAEKEAYTLRVTKNQIEIVGAETEGVFRGMQTLFQLIPASEKTKKNKSNVGIPGCIISDRPSFLWRGLNLDCSRHFMSKDFIKRYIDILAYYKMNVLHWHVTDDQGWRIEIKKYPKLTEVGAWRKEADGSSYGGFYTQQDIKEIVAYAQSRFITVVPEIEMPGHSTASLASYPENSCTGGPFDVTNIWGVHKDIYCAGRDSTFEFLQNILDEVMALFPGKYIHIGGDEAPNDRWKNCPKCQERITAEGLKDEHELQSYFIKRISKYLQSKGREIIGWDEILQGGLAPGAIVQSWQSFQGAVEAAKLEHYTICSPASHTYLDSDPDAIDLRIAYSFHPVPDGLTVSEQKFVLGGEASLWTEQAPQETVDRQLFPRILALTDIFWNNPLQRNYDEFYARVQQTYDDLTALGIHYGRETKIFTPSISFDSMQKEFIVSFLQGQQGVDIRYTTDNNQPTEKSALYLHPLKIRKTTTLTVAAFNNDVFLGKQYTLSFAFHKALNARIIVKNPYDERYRAGGEDGLIDGVRGTNNFKDGSWQGYEGVDFECSIDLGSVKEISKVIPRFLSNTSSWIFLPVKIEIAISHDSTTFTDSKTILNDAPQKNSDIVVKDFTADFGKQRARYIKVKAESVKKCPEWHPGSGGPAWLFLDEIVVE
ncbi:MAG: family 20 glycosylhydrolase [Bacteroidota bacterium]